MCISAHQQLGKLESIVGFQNGLRKGCPMNTTSLNILKAALTSTDKRERSVKQFDREIPKSN